MSILFRSILLGQNLLLCFVLRKLAPVFQWVPWASERSRASLWPRRWGLWYQPGELRRGGHCCFFCSVGCCGKPSESPLLAPASNCGVRACRGLWTRLVRLLGIKRLQLESRGFSAVGGLARGSSSPGDLLSVGQDSIGVWNVHWFTCVSAAKISVARSHRKWLGEAEPMACRKSYGCAVNLRKLLHPFLVPGYYLEPFYRYCSKQFTNKVSVVIVVSCVKNHELNKRQGRINQLLTKR